MFFCVLSAQVVEEEWPLEAEYQLDQDKLEDIKKYLDNIQPETQSVITVSDDSGLETHGTESVLGVEDINGQYFCKVIPLFSCFTPH